MHLVDTTPRLVELARRHNKSASHRLASTVIGDARQLSFAASVAEVVLICGPLYHLQAKEERLAALVEARRIAREGGVVIAAGISRFAAILDGLMFHPNLDEPLLAMRHRAAATGSYRNDTGNRRYFRTAYFHRPAELAEELCEAGFRAVQVFGVEGPGGLISDFDKRWNDAVGRGRILGMARLVEAETSMIGASAHMLAIGRS